MTGGVSDGLALGISRTMSSTIIISSNWAKLLLAIKVGSLTIVSTMGAVSCSDDCSLEVGVAVLDNSSIVVEMGL